MMIMKYMHNYKDNETYEKDRTHALVSIEKFFEGELDAELISLSGLQRVLENSKWVGADSDTFKPCTLLKDVNVTTKSI